MSLLRLSSQGLRGVKGWALRIYNTCASEHEGDLVSVMPGNLGTAQPPARGGDSPGQRQVSLDKDAAAMPWGLLPAVPAAQVSGEGCGLKQFPQLPRRYGPRALSRARSILG